MSDDLISKKARYIDAEKAKRAVFWDADSIEAIDQVPTADVVEVVRCKDCKYATGWTTKNGLYGGLTCESLVDMDVDEDFFCAFGEMKEKESVK